MKVAVLSRRLHFHFLNLDIVVVCCAGYEFIIRFQTQSAGYWRRRLQSMATMELGF